MLGRRHPLDDARHDLGQGEERRRQPEGCTALAGHRERRRRRGVGDRRGVHRPRDETPALGRRVRLRPERVRSGRTRQLARHGVPRDHADACADPRSSTAWAGCSVGAPDVAVALDQRSRRDRHRRGQRHGPRDGACCSPTRGHASSSPTSAADRVDAVVDEIRAVHGDACGARCRAPTSPTTTQLERLVAAHRRVGRTARHRGQQRRHLGDQLAVPGRRRVRDELGPDPRREPHRPRPPGPPRAATPARVRRGRIVNIASTEALVSTAGLARLRSDQGRCDRAHPVARRRARPTRRDGQLRSARARSTPR